ncbi:origin recognition complex subunit 2-domain-containing protein [Xylogone sp. PMI_703]|nr:origin recognition complex subunit 2-domain-containing protein [Xylogone sp. PMI_703]
MDNLSPVENAKEVEAATPRRGRGRPKGSKNKNKLDKSISTELASGKSPLSTPVKLKGPNDFDGSRLPRNADRSARRKSTKMIIERTILGGLSDNDEDDEDIAQHIYDSEKDDKPDPDDVEVTVDVITGSDIPATPSKRGRGRPKGSKNRKRSLTPPGDLPPHELYFSQNRGGGAKTSNNNLSSVKLLDHDEYFSLAHKYKDRHADDLQFLQNLHERSFSQWLFELSQDFSICVYGWGSKRPLLMRFVDHFYNTEDGRNSKIVIVNGYVQTLTTRDILNTVANSFSQSDRKLGSQPVEMLENLITYLEEDKTQHIMLVIHSIDGLALRRPQTQTILSRLSSHAQVSLVASADHPSFPLLWDSSLRLTYNFLFHDCTTFQPYTVETDVVDEVHSLLGRNTKRVGGKEGVTFVLKSLPENAKNLFRVLIAEQLVAMDENSGGFEAMEDNYDDETTRGVNSSGTNGGVEYRVLYQKAVEEFICSNDMNFRTLLKEFHDHQMIQSHKDAMGTEILSVPFRKEELEAILEDIMS